MQAESARARAMNVTRDRILDAALEILSRTPAAAMDEIASAAGVVRRTLYGHFPTRADLVRTLAGRAVEQIEAVLAEVTATDQPADAQWADFVARLWPVAHRYRILVTLRRGEYGEEIHAMLAPVDQALAGIVQRGQDSEVFGRHLPADLLGRLAEAAVFTIADDHGSGDPSGISAATIASLLLLGVPEPRARALANAQR